MYLKSYAWQLPTEDIGRFNSISCIIVTNISALIPASIQLKVLGSEGPDIISPIYVPSINTTKVIYFDPPLTDPENRAISFLPSGEGGGTTWNVTVIGR